MNKSMYTKITFFCVILFIVSLRDRVQAEPIQPDAERISRISEDIGREDPFAQLPEPLRGQRISKPAIIDDFKPELFVETVTLKFLDAKNLKIALNSMASEYGSIAVDNNTNTIIVCDTNDQLGRIITEIKKVDRTPEQIMIEVVIVDVQLDDDTEIGVNWGRVFKSTRQKTTQYKQTLASTLDTTGVLGGDFSFIDVDGISVTLHALQETKDIEILASPRILVVSGKSALIKTIEEIPYVEESETSAGGSLTSTEFKEVGVTLEVTATLTDDNKIIMTIKAEQSAKTGESINNVPVVDTRGAETTLLMEDDQVVVMGGLRKKEITFTEKKVPLLGDLPIVGLFFTDDRKEVKYSELLVFISPHIYKGAPIPEEVMQKYREITERSTLSVPDKSKKGWFGIMNSE